MIFPRILTDDSNRAAGAFFIEQQFPVMFSSEQLRKVARRDGEGSQKSQPATGQRQPAPPGTHSRSSPHGNTADQGGPDRHEGKAAFQSQVRNQKKTSGQGARDAARSIQGENHTGIPAGSGRAGNQPHGGGKRGAQQKRRDQNDANRSGGKTRSHRQRVLMRQIKG